MSTPLLTEADKQRYEESGYLTLPSIANKTELLSIRNICAALMAKQTGFECGDFLDLAGDDVDPAKATLPQLLMPSKYDPRLNCMGLKNLACEIAQELLGDAVVAEGEHVILKPAGIGAVTPLHQDEAFWSDETDYQSLSIWFPLQNVDHHNGCLHFVPGSHRLGIFPHHHVMENKTYNGLEVDNSDQFHPIPAPLKLGSATVHHCRTLHGGSPNQSSEPRYAYIFGFGLPAKPAKKPRNYYWLRSKEVLRERRATEQGYELTKMHPELEGEPLCS